MAKRTGPTNIHLKNLIRKLKGLSREKNVKIWKAVAEELEKSTRKRAAVNLSKINKYSKENETVVVPGKLLSNGSLDHKVLIAAFQFSELAKEKSNCINIEELIEKNPSGKGIRIIK